MLCICEKGIVISIIVRHGNSSGASGGPRGKVLSLGKNESKLCNEFSPRGASLPRKSILKTRGARALLGLRYGIPVFTRGYEKLWVRMQLDLRYFMRRK